MDKLMTRYLDGEIAEDEAEKFLSALAEDPSLEVELRSREAAIDLVAHTAFAGPSKAFTATVMDRIRTRTGHPPTVVHNRNRMAMAAILLIGLGFGYSAGIKLSSGPQHNASLNPITEQHPMSMESREVDSAANRDLQFVRLVFQPTDPEVTQVGVAGTFNRWDAAGTPMHQENGVWTAWLVLQPDVYEYMFVLNGDKWVADPLAVQTRSDGFGNANSVLDIGL